MRILLNLHFSLANRIDKIWPTVVDLNTKLSSKGSKQLEPTKNILFSQMWSTGGSTRCWYAMCVITHQSDMINLDIIRPIGVDALCEWTISCDQPVLMRYVCDQSVTVNWGWYAVCVINQLRSIGADRLCVINQKSSTGADQLDANWNKVFDELCLIRYSSQM
jgi:hypothetical protein